MSIARARAGESVWRRVFPFVAAYLLVLQSALAGAGMQRVPVGEDPAQQIICLNGASGGHGDHATPFDCCGIGCLVGAQVLDGPDSPEQALTYPGERRLEPGPLVEAVVSIARSAEGPGPRGPPTGA